jgi:hypothetical protein
MTEAGSITHVNTSLDLKAGLEFLRSSRKILNGQHLLAEWTDATLRNKIHISV